MSDDGPESALVVHRAAVDEMVLPKIASGTLLTNKALGDFLMSTAVKGTLKLIAELTGEKFVDTYHRYMDKYATALEAKNRFDEAAVAIERRIAQGDPATTRVLEGLMSANGVGKTEAKFLLMTKTREILRVKVEAAAAERRRNNPSAGPVAPPTQPDAAEDGGYSGGGGDDNDERAAALVPSTEHSSSPRPAEAAGAAGAAAGGAVVSAPVSRRATGTGEGEGGGNTSRRTSSAAAGGSSSSSSASVPPSMFTSLRTAVSKKKKRFVDGRFNLDLSYIPLRDTEDVPAQIISMGFPCQGSEKLYRNPYDEVLQFFEERHPRNYIVFNLCSERKYQPQDFEEAGSACGVNMNYRFHDHNPPPLGYFGPFCQDMEDFLSQGPDRVAAVHCKAGKGRTGTMIVAYLACKLRVTVPDAMDVFSRHRTKDGKGVTIPSQKRFLYYFGMILEAAYKGATVGVGDNAGRSGLGAAAAAVAEGAGGAGGAGEAGGEEKDAEPKEDGEAVGDGGAGATGPAAAAAAAPLPPGDAQPAAAKDAEEQQSFHDQFFATLAHHQPLRPFYRSLLPPVQPVLLMSISFLGVPSVDRGGFTPYFVIENNAWQKVYERNDKVHNTPTWVLSSKQLGLPSNFVRAEGAGGAQHADNNARVRRLSSSAGDGAGAGSPAARSPSRAQSAADAQPPAPTSTGADSAQQQQPPSPPQQQHGHHGGARKVQVLTLELPEPVELVNEVRITVYHKNSLRQKKKMFGFWVHTGFLDRQTTFSKIEIDGAHKDKKHKIYPASFRLQLNVEKLDPHVSAEEMYARQSTQAEGFASNSRNNARNASLVSVRTVVEEPGENESTLLGGLKPTASQAMLLGNDDDDDTESSEDEYGDAEFVGHPSPATQSAAANGSGGGADGGGEASAAAAAPAGDAAVSERAPEAELAVVTAAELSREPGEGATAAAAQDDGGIITDM